MSTDPATPLRYSSDHCWARREADGTVTVGLTDFAQSALGDLVFVELPTVGAAFAADEAVAEVESTKAVSEVYLPLAGSVTAVNEALATSPHLINTDPYVAGWVCRVDPSDPGALDRLLDATGYAELTDSAVSSQPSTKD